MAIRTKKQTITIMQILRLFQYRLELLQSCPTQKRYFLVDRVISSFVLSVACMFETKWADLSLSSNRPVWILFCPSHIPALYFLQRPLETKIERHLSTTDGFHSKSITEQQSSGKGPATKADEFSKKVTKRGVGHSGAQNQIETTLLILSSN